MQPPLSKSVQCQAYNGNITPFKQGLSPSLTPTVDKGVISIHFLPVKQEHLVQRPVSSSSRRCYRSSPLHPNPAACLLSVGKETDFNHKTHQHPSGQEVKDLLTHGESLDMSPIMVGVCGDWTKAQGFLSENVDFRKTQARRSAVFLTCAAVRKVKNPINISKRSYRLSYKPICPTTRSWYTHCSSMSK
jgi:hypothetical protein